MVGSHVIDEGRLQALDAAALGDLHAEGFLMPAFMAVASIGRLRDLIATAERPVAIIGGAGWDIAASTAILIRWVAPTVDWPERPWGSAPATLK